MHMPNEQRLPVGCVVMAAGSARRFGANKLNAAVGGRTLIRRALEAVPVERLAAVCVVTQYDEVEALAEEYGFRCVRNRHPEWGVSHTIRLGTEDLARRCGALLFMVADQPLLQRETVAAMVEAYLAQPERILALAHNGVRGNPCLFPADCFPELCRLSGDTGGSAVIRRHPERLTLLEAPERELLDADTPEMLALLE